MNKLFTLAAVALSSSLFLSFDSVLAHSCYNNAVTNDGPAPIGSKCQLEWTTNGTTYNSCGAHFSSVKPYIIGMEIPKGIDRWCSLVPDYDPTDPKKRDMWGFCTCPPGEECGGVLNKVCSEPGEYCSFQPGAKPEDTGVCSTKRCGIPGCKLFFDGCNDCTCGTDGKMSCTKKSCDVRGPAACKNPSLSCPKGCESWFDGCNTCECSPNGLISTCTEKVCKKYQPSSCKKPFDECISGSPNACKPGYRCVTPSGSAPGSKGVCMVEKPCYDETKKLDAANKQFISYAVYYYKNILNQDEQAIMMNMLHAH